MTKRHTAQDRSQELLSATNINILNTQRVFAFYLCGNLNENYQRIL